MLLPQAFYEQKTVTVARQLLGKVLVRKIGRKQLSAMIVETEAYLQDDPASHSYRGLTPRCAPMFGPAGRAYVYFTYGMYHCFNVVTEKEGYGGAVLIRALEPLTGITEMQKNRDKEKLRDLASGPGKLCIALGITKQENQKDLCRKKDLYIVDQPLQIKPQDIVQTTRIGISDARHFKYRFYLKGNSFVSVK
jgi:DNA-3-methyladenine glycosylase